MGEQFFLVSWLPMRAARAGSGSKQIESSLCNSLNSLCEFFSTVRLLRPLDFAPSNFRDVCFSSFLPCSCCHAASHACPQLPCICSSRSIDNTSDSRRLCETHSVCLSGPRVSEANHLRYAAKHAIARFYSWRLLFYCAPPWAINHDISITALVLK